MLVAFVGAFAVCLCLFNRCNVVDRFVFCLLVMLVFVVYCAGCVCCLCCFELLCC